MVKELKMLEYMVLTILYKAGADSRVYGMSLNGINNQNGTQLATRKYLQRLIKRLEAEGYIAEGYPDGNAKTYYLTGQGMEIVKEEQGE